MSEKRIIERLESFENALSRLEEALTKEIDDDIIIDATIRRFEFTFELAWKLMRDYLENSGIPGIASPKSIIKSAFKTELIIDGEGWIEMLKHRNLTAMFIMKKQLLIYIKALRRRTSYC